MSETHITESTTARPKAGFGRIFEGMYTGSMIGAGTCVFAVWPYVIAHMRGHAEHGALVELNPKLLGFILGAPEADVSAAIEYLCEPDLNSRSKQEDGRRLVRMGEFLYRVVNGAHYISIRVEDDRRFAHAQRQARYDKKRKRKSVRAAGDDRERRFADAAERGDEAAAEAIAAEGLPSVDGRASGGS